MFKKAYQIFRERGYRIRLLSAAFRNHMHWSELIGGDIVISPPYSWQVRFNASDIEVRPRIDNPVDQRIVEELSRKFRRFPACLHRGRPLGRRVRFIRSQPPDAPPVHRRVQ